MSDSKQEEPLCCDKYGEQMCTMAALPASGMKRTLFPKLCHHEAMRSDTDCSPVLKEPAMPACSRGRAAQSGPPESGASQLVWGKFLEQHDVHCIHLPEASLCGNQD
jgi:hypothetical protein